MQAVAEIRIFSKHQIYTATSIEQLDEAIVNLVFCDNVQNKSVSVEDLENHIIRLNIKRKDFKEY